LYKGGPTIGVVDGIDDESVNDFFFLILLLLHIQQKNTIKAMIRSNRTPPRTPATTASIFNALNVVVLVLGVVVSMGNDVSSAESIDK
jgi:hypothetical protein